MNNSIYKFSLDIHEITSQILIELKQDDTAKEFHISLTENGRPYIVSDGCYAVFTALKPDGKKIFNGGEEEPKCKIIDNVIHYKVTPQTVAALGEVLCEIKLFGEDNALLTSPSFVIVVTPAVYQIGDALESTDEYTALVEAYTKANKLFDDVSSNVMKLEYILNSAGTEYGVRKVFCENNNETVLLIPDFYNGLPVANVSLSNLTDISVLNSVTDFIIGENVRSVTFPETNQFFWESENLKNIFFGGGLNYISNAQYTLSNLGPNVENVYYYKHFSLKEYLATKNIGGKPIAHHDNGFKVIYNLISKSADVVPMVVNGGKSKMVQSDMAQNDPTQPDYIKNRLVYEGRTFEDIEAVEYPEQIVASMETEDEGAVYQEPMLIKFCELPEGADPLEFVENIDGFGSMGEEIRFSDPEMFPTEYLNSIECKEVTDINGKVLGVYLTIETMPYVIVINEDNFLYEHVSYYEGNGERYEEIIHFRFPEKGVYTLIFGAEENDNGEIVKYYTCDKIFFKNVKTLDKKFLPPEILYPPKIELDDYVKLGSENAVTSNAVANALDRKLNKPSNDMYEGYVLKIQYGAPSWAMDQTGMTEMGVQALLANKGVVTKDNFSELKDEIQEAQQEIEEKINNGHILTNAEWANVSIAISRANITYELLEFIQGRESNPENEGKVLAIKDGKINLVDLNTLIS